MDIKSFSFRYDVRKIKKTDSPKVYALCKTNPTYYYYMKEEPSIESIAQDLQTLPPHKTMEDKFFVGFYFKDRLIAVLDLIVSYPNPQTVFIGWFILEKKMQGKGIGSTILTELLTFLKKQNFSRARLGYIKGNLESQTFWKRNGFYPTGEESPQEHSPLL